MTINDGSDGVPRLELQQSWWAMSTIGSNGREWTIEEKFEQIAKAGFTGILGRLPEQDERARWRRLLDEYNFSFGIQSFPGNREDIVPLLRHAKEFGVQYVNSQVMDHYVINEDAVQLLSELVEEGSAAGIPYVVETHRGRVTQDLHRTVDYVKAIPDLRLTLDISHYVVAGEMVGGFDEKAEALFDPLLRRTSAIHGRVSNGEQVQVDIGADGDHPMVAPFVRLWEKAIGYWLSQAQPGDVLPFVCELGPPDYAIIRRSIHGGYEEISNRWEQSLVFKRLAEEAWSRVSMHRTPL